MSLYINTGFGSTNISANSIKTAGPTGSFLYILNDLFVTGSSGSILANVISSPSGAFMISSSNIIISGTTDFDNDVNINLSKYLKVGYIDAYEVFATNNFIGNLTGTSSWAYSSSQAVSSSYAITASYALTASYAPSLPAGVNTSIQFNDGGALSGSSNFTFGKSTNTVSLLNGGNVIISSSATPSNTPLLIDIKSGSTNGAYHALGIATQDGGGIGLGYNGYPSTYKLEMSPWTSGEATLVASNQTNGFKIQGASTKLTLTTDLPSFPITLRPGSVATGGGIVEVSGSIHQTGSVYFKSLSISSKPHILVYDTGSGQLFVTASSALGVTINNNTDNYIVTATGTSNTLDGESNLSFNGSILTVSGSMILSSSAPVAVAGGIYYDGTHFYLGF